MGMSELFKLPLKVYGSTFIVKDTVGKIITTFSSLEHALAFCDLVNSHDKLVEELEAKDKIIAMAVKALEKYECVCNDADYSLELCPRCKDIGEINEALTQIEAMKGKE